MGGPGSGPTTGVPTRGGAAASRPGVDPGHMRPAPPRL